MEGLAKIRRLYQEMGESETEPVRDFEFYSNQHRIQFKVCGYLKL